jgi:uncharacterized protein (TIGR02145 family)
VTSIIQKNSRTANVRLAGNIGNLTVDQILASGIIIGAQPDITAEGINENLINSNPLGYVTKLFTQLNPGTTYYARGFIRTAENTYYSNSEAFTTDPYTDLPSVTIGNQKWATKNLAVSRFRNGDPIPNPLPDTTLRWIYAGAPLFAYPQDDVSLVDTYGHFYNYYAVVDPRGLCPYGWHVPSYSEYFELATSLGGLAVAGPPMRTVDLWQTGNNAIPGTNSSGFSAVPGGWRFGSDPIHKEFGQSGKWWIVNGSAAYTRYYDNGISIGGPNQGFYIGLAVRCIAD